MGRLDNLYDYVFEILEKYDNKELSSGYFARVKSWVIGEAYILDDLFNYAVESKNAQAVYLLTKYLGYDAKKGILAIIDISLETKDMAYLIDFAKLEGVPVVTLSIAVQLVGSFIDMIIFARDVKGAPILELACAVKDLKNKEYIKMFMDNVEMSDDIRQILEDAYKKLEKEEMKKEVNLSDYLYEQENREIDKGIATLKRRR